MSDVRDGRTHFGAQKLFFYLPDKVFSFHSFEISPKSSLR